MLDLIKTLVVALVQSVPRIQDMRTDKKRRELGASLFILYVRLNEATIAAHSIIGSLEVYVQRMKDHLETGNDAYALTAGNWIAEKVQHQITNFERIRELLDRNSEVLQIIDAQSYNQLRPLLDRKFGALNWLLTAMRSGSLPIGPTAEDLEYLTHLEGGQHNLHLAMRELRPRWRKDGLQIAAEWGEETYAKVVAYLQERNPRDQLAQIEASLSILREALEKNFTIADVLLEVRDARLENRY